MSNKGKFKLHEIVLVLLFLQHRPIGRYVLADLVGTSKARVRGILEFLNEMDLIIPRSGRAGTILSKDGIELVAKLKKSVFLNYKEQYFKHPPGLKITEEATSILIKVPTDDINGLYERDIAVREGANGAITLTKNDKWLLPPYTGRDSEINIEMSKEIQNEYNMISIVFGNPNYIHRAASAIACDHLEDYIYDLFEFLPRELIIRS